MYKISIVIPTFNCASLLRECLRSVRKQNYPQDLLDLIIIDGHSNDNTIEVALKYRARILRNDEVIHPRGRAIGIDHSDGDLILCLDSDNVLSGKDWLLRMTSPFSDPEIAAAEPLYYLSHNSDNLITRYCSLIGGDDPLVSYLGFNDRYSYLTGKWTNTIVKEEDFGDYLKIGFPNPNNIPSLGANGFMVREGILKKVDYDPFYHIGVAHQIIHDGGSWAKVKTGIVHNHGNSLFTFILKKKRRAERRLNRNKGAGYIYPVSRTSIFRLFMKAVLVFPILFDALRAFMKKPDPLWFCHPVFFYSVLCVYGYTFLLRKLSPVRDEEYEKI